MKQTLTLLLFFFTISLSAQILTNSSKIGPYGYTATFSDWVYPQKKNIIFNSPLDYYYQNTINDSTGNILFFNNRTNFYTKDGDLMPHSPKNMIELQRFSYGYALSTIYLGDGNYRCYFFNEKSLYSLTINMKLNNGKGDLIDSVPTLHYRDSLKKINEMAVFQTDTLRHKLIVAFENGPTVFAVVSHNQPGGDLLKLSKFGMASYSFHDNPIRLSNNKKMVAMYSAHIYDISDTIPVFMKNIVTDQSFDCYANSVFSPNDSLIYSFFRVDTVLRIEQQEVFSGKRTGEDSYSYYFKVKSNKSSNNEGFLAGFPAELLPNRKIIFAILNYENRLTSIIHRPDVFGKGCQIEFVDSNYKVLDSSSWFGAISSPLHFTQFDLKSVGTECGGSLIPNISDPLFKKFVWYNLLGDSSESIGHTPGKVKFLYNGQNVLVMKGVTQSGYTAWFTDTVETSCFVKANFYSKDSLGCQWIAQTFVDSSCLNTYLYDPGTKWTWDFGDGDIVQTDTPLIAHVFKKSGYFKVKMTIQNKECIDAITKERAIFIKPAPKPGFELSSNNWCKSFPITLKDQIGSGFTHKIYVWGDGDSIVLTDSTTILHHTYTQLGSYTIKQYLYSVSGCVNMFEQVIQIHPSYRLADALPAPTVSVVNNMSVAVRFKSVEDPKGYQIYRSDLGWFETVTDTMFIDYLAMVNQSKYTYAVRVVDHCNNVSLTSEKENSILLTGVQHKHIDAVLSANRSLVSNEPHQLMTETASGEFVELVPDFHNAFTDTKFYNDSMWDRTYFIQYCRKSDTSCERMYSNKIVFTYVPDVFIPTFISKSQNPFFVPKVTLMSSGDIVIYDIMGRKVYESNNLNDPIYVDHFGTGYHVYLVNGIARDKKDYADRGKILVIE